MGLLGRLFGRKEKNSSDIHAEKAAPSNDFKDIDKIKVFDEYGRELFISKGDWRNSVLIPNLEKNKNNPNELYSILYGALEDGFASDIITYAEKLWRVEHNSSRAAVLLGVVYITLDRLDDAEKLFNGYLATHGEDGYILTNLAKIYSRRGDEAKAEATLWHALEVDPNQDNGFGWYVAIYRERGGEAAELDAYRRVAALPGSWRAYIWLGRNSLEKKDLQSAMSFYGEAISSAGHPAPTDLLMQMSGDLGNKGYLEEIIKLVTPLFEPAFHGIMVGNNLIKANCDLGKLDAAYDVLNKLYAQKRPDWKENLQFWDTELAKTRVAKDSKMPPPQSATVFTIEGPLWMRDSSPFASLIPTKKEHAVRIVVFGSTFVPAKELKEPLKELSTSSGRLSRVIPLFFTEKIHLATDAISKAMIPAMANGSFILFAKPYEDTEIFEIARKCNEVPDFMISVVINEFSEKWNIVLRLLSVSDASCLAEIQGDAIPDNPGPAVTQLAERMITLLIRHTGILAITPPLWYQVPAALVFNDYLLRLEQQLAVFLSQEKKQPDNLSGEREMLDGILQLAVNNSRNPLVRIVLVRTLYHLNNVRPDIVAEYKDKILLLQKNYPIEGEPGALIDSSIKNIFE